MECPWGKEIQIKSLGSCMPHPRGLNFYAVIYREMIKKSSSQELLYPMGQYTEWNIPRTDRFKIVQMKSLGSQMSTP